MTSLKKYLFVYNNKDASELGANPVIDIVFIVLFMSSLRSPCFKVFLFFFAFLLTRFGV